MYTFEELTLLSKIEAYLNSRSSTQYLKDSEATIWQSSSRRIFHHLPWLSRIGSVSPGADDHIRSADKPEVFNPTCCRVCPGIHPLWKYKQFRKLSAKCSNCLAHRHSGGGCRRNFGHAPNNTYKAHKPITLTLLNNFKKLFPILFLNENYKILRSHSHQLSAGYMIVGELDYSLLTVVFLIPSVTIILVMLEMKEIQLPVKHSQYGELMLSKWTPPNIKCPSLGPTPLKGQVQYYKICL